MKSWMVAATASTLPALASAAPLGGGRLEVGTQGGLTLLSSAAGSVAPARGFGGNLRFGLALDGEFVVGASVALDVSQFGPTTEGSGTRVGLSAGGGVYGSWYALPQWGMLRPVVDVGLSGTVVVLVNTLFVAGGYASLGLAVFLTDSVALVPAVTARAFLPLGDGGGPSLALVGGWGLRVFLP